MIHTTTREILATANALLREDGVTVAREADGSYAVRSAVASGWFPTLDEALAEAEQMALEAREHTLDAAAEFEDYSDWADAEV